MKKWTAYRTILAMAGLFLTLPMMDVDAWGAMDMPSEDVIVQWNNVSLGAIQVAQYRATQASRVLAMVHGAMFDAINNIDPACENYHVTAAAPTVISREAAAAAAAYRVLVTLFPAQTATFDTAIAESLLHVPNGDRETNGVAFGNQVGNLYVAWRSADHSGDIVPYVPGSGPGDWQPTPPDYGPAMMPNWATVTPFAMTSNSQFRPIAYPDLTSAEYANDFNQVKTLGAKTGSVRTPAQSETAMFWVDMPGTITTVGRWNKIAQQVAGNQFNNIWQNARLFALLNIALADAGIAAWDCKYEYNFWRPITAIRAADTDGNPLTEQNAAWEPFIMTPAFPEYVSAHSTFSAAAAGILTEFFGRDTIDFTISSYMMPMDMRNYHSFTQAAEEAGISRIYGGIHFNSANVRALSAGKELAGYVFNNFLKPLTFTSTGPVDTDPADSDGDGNSFNDNIELHMTAGDGFVNMADGKLQYMFGFGNATGVPDDMVLHHGMMAAEFPAPTIALREGQTLYLNLTNVGMMARPDLFDPHTIHWHGFPNAAPIFDGVPDASISINMGSTLTYYYKVVEPGTFLWHCHVEATEHMQMGMLGQLYVEPRQNMLPDGTNLNGFTHHTGYKYAYNDGDGSTFYDVDAPIQISSFDPAFHDASFGVQPLPFAMMDDRYPMFNGRGYPDTVNPNPLMNTAMDEGYMSHESQKIHALITATKGQKILLRISSVSTTSFHTLSVPGIPMKVVAKGSRLLRGPTGKDLSYWTQSVDLGGGQTTDVILDTSSVAAGTYILYSTNLNHLSNDNQDFGGMMTEIILNP